MATDKKEFDYRNSPTAWFCALEIARNRGDFEQAAEAVRELKRLNVTVKFKGTPARKLAEAEQKLKKATRAGFMQQGQR